MARGPSPAWQRRLKLARSLNAEKVAIRKEMLAERRGRAWPINLAPDPGGRFALHQALEEEWAERTEYIRILRIFNELVREGKPLAIAIARGEPRLFLVGRGRGTNLYRLPARDDEDQETPFQEWTAIDWMKTTAWVRLFLREAGKRGYAIEDIDPLLDGPGMTAEILQMRIQGSC